MQCPSITARLPDHTRRRSALPAAAEVAGPRPAVGAAHRDAMNVPAGAAGHAGGCLPSGVIRPAITGGPGNCASRPIRRVHCFAQLYVSVVLRGVARARERSNPPPAAILVPTRGPHTDLIDDVLTSVLLYAVVPG
jgi:hypothetical protein